LEDETVHVRLNHKATLRCELDSDSSTLQWQKNGSDYTTIALTRRNAVAYIGPASPELNGSRFECLASYGDGEAQVVKTVTIIVEGTK
jgi:hypothetical protein